MMAETDSEVDPPKNEDPKAREKAEEALRAANPIDALKAEAIPLFKTWAERFNDGKGMKWSDAYSKLTGVVLAEGQVMDAADYKILIDAFRDALSKE